MNNSKIKSSFELAPDGQKSELKIQLQQIIHDQFGVENSVDLDIPSSLDHGDWSTNIALKISKELGKNPREIAEGIVEDLKRSEIAHQFSKIEIAGPGFINFYLSEDALGSVLQEILNKRELYGQGNVYEGKKVMVEFTDPNPLKEFHIGHLYSNTVGESLARLFEAQGAEVWRVCYQGDVGLHVAKAIYGIEQLLEVESLVLDDVAQKDLVTRAKFLGQAYALGATLYESENGAKEKIVEINKKIYDKDPEFYSIYEITKKWSLEYFDSLYRRLGTEFKRYYFESEAATRGMMIVRENMNKVFVNDQGSVIFPKEKSGLHTRVFVNSQGLPTYEAKELGLAPWKFDEFPYDVSVIVTGNEINEYFKVLLKALSIIRPDLAARTRHISHGMVRLPSGKMSSRTGDVITGDWLLNTVRDAVYERSQKEGRIDHEAADIIGVAAIKYSLLKSQIGSEVTFNIEESIALDGNSGPYLLYTYVRCKSVLSKSGKEIHKLAGVDFQENEVELVRIMGQFPTIVDRVSHNLSPSDIATYLYKLAKEFNLFYEKNKIIGDSREILRLSLVAAVMSVLENGLWLLGIKSVDKM